MSRVRIGTCSGPADAALVRSLFDAHGVPVVVGAENHTGVLGGLGGSFLSLDIWVDEQDSEDAVALLRDLRERDASGDQADYDADHDADYDDVDGEAPAGVSGTNDDARDASGTSVQLRTDRRRRTAFVLLLGCCVTFGTAHMFLRSWMRGLALAALEIVGIRKLWDGHEIGIAVVVAASLADVIGALWNVWTVSKPDLPAARLHGE